jgi:hypothetical protein
MVKGPSESKTDAVTGTADDDLSDELRARVKSELEPGERLLWAARACPPPARVGMGYFVAGAAAFALLSFGVLAIANSLGDFRARVNHESALPWGIALCVFGCLTVIAMIASGISGWVEQHRMSNACYAVTDRRAISWVPEPKTDAVRILCLRPGQIEGVVRVERPDGSGSLEMSYSKDSGPYHWPIYKFEHIAQVRRVEQIVRNNLMRSEGSI